MKTIQKIGFFSLVLLLASCGTKKNTFVARNYQALTTKFNVLYNGKIAFQQGIDEINSKYQDDFWELLPIEPLKFEENKIAVPKLTPSFRGPGSGSQQNTQEKTLPPFEKAEEKAVKAIQKHSMKIYGKERNSQIDDAYLLLGKSRYYTQRFVPAIEAFNYIIENYPTASLINETKIWRAKAHIRIQNEELAIETLKILLNQNKLPDLIKEEAYTALAMAYTKMDSIEAVKKYLWLATETAENKVQTARNLFVLGQLYGLEKQKDSASLVFEKLIKSRKGPYKYRIHANIELAKNSVSDSTTVVLLERFRKLIKNRDNRPYLDGLYYEVGELNESRDSIGLAIQNYKKSLRAKGGTPKQKTYSYEKLAAIYFKNLDYVTAGAYYDSVLSVAENKQTLRIKKIERRAKNLTALSKFENVLQTNDSILRLTRLTEKERNKFFQTYIDKLKKEDQEIAQRRLNSISFGNSFGGGAQFSKKKGKWYFYNIQSLGFGKGEFEKVWGTRPLEDNWRWSDKTQIAKTKIDSVTINQKDARYELATYLKTIPSEQSEIDSLIFDRNQALFELGLIYKEQFKNKVKSVGNLERLLTLNPIEELVLPTNYHLFQLYTEDGDRKAEMYKNRILKDYADSPFAQIILNPEKEIVSDKKVDEVSDLYKIAYNLYKDESFEEAVCFIEKSIPTLEGSLLIPKFKLLKAYAVGKYQKKEAYIAALEKVAVEHPLKEEGKKALEILGRLKK